MIDWSRVSELRKEVGSEGFDEVVDLFIEEVSEVLTRLKTISNCNSLEDDLHFLKGSALSLGFREFSKLCQDGERNAAAGASNSINLVEILDLYERSKQEFMAKLSERGACKSLEN